MPTEWTVETLREHLMSLMEAERGKNEARFSGIEKATQAALAAAERAAEKAENIIENRLEGLPCDSMADQVRLLMPRAEADSRLTALADQLKDLASRIDRQEGRGSGLSAGWGYLVGAVGLIAAIIAIIVRFL